MEAIVGEARRGRVRMRIGVAGRCIAVLRI